VRQVSRVATRGVAGGRTAVSVRETLYARAAARAIPVKAVLELTKRCNLRCYQCYVADPGEELTSVRVMGVLRELADEGCLGVTLTGGEVGIRADFLSVAEEVKRLRMQLSVLTNGTVFDDDTVRCLARLKPARVAVSFYGGTAAPHERVTGVPGSFDRAVHTVHQLRGLGVSCRLHGVLLKETCGEFAAIAGLAESMGCDWRFDPSVGPAEDGDLRVVDHRVPVEWLSDFFQHPMVKGRTREHAASRHEPALYRSRATTCGAGVTAVFIAADGDAFACMGFPPAFGSVVEHPFAEIWRGPVAEAHREAMRQPLAECDRCELLRYCTLRCPRIAKVEDGDVSGPSKRACDLAAVVRGWREQLRDVG